MEIKKDIRKRVLELRSAIGKEEWEEKSCRIQKQVVTHPFFLNTDTIYCYVDYRNEVGTQSIIDMAWELQKQIAVPKIEGDEMKFYYISNFEELEVGYRGIKEPSSNHIADEKSALIIMPGVAFDRNRNRIGYGKGFYDRFLEKHPSYKTMAIAFECQMVDSIEADIYDLKPDILITEEHIYNEKFTK